MDSATILKKLQDENVIAVELTSRGLEALQRPADIDDLLARLRTLGVPASLFNTAEEYRKTTIHIKESTPLTFAPFGKYPPEVGEVLVLHTLNVRGRGDHYFWWVQCA